MPKFDESRAAELIGKFYEAAVRPELWRGLLADTANALGAEGCALTPAPGSPLLPISSPSLDEIVDTGNRDRWFDDNPRVARGIKTLLAAPQDVVTEEVLFTPWELDNLPFHAEYVNRFKLRHFAGMVVYSGPDGGLAFSIERTARQGSFSAAEIETLRRLVPHIQQAGQLSMRLADARHDGMFESLSMCDCGALLLDRRGRITRANAKAESLLGPWLMIRHGSLMTGRKDRDAALQELIGSVIRQGPLQDLIPAGAIAIPRPGMRPLAIHAAPLVRSAKDAFQPAAAILMIVDPNSRHIPLEPLLCQAFHFTGAEAMVAVALCRGHDVDEIAQMRGVSTATVRAQMKAMFAKTGTRRQAELVALLLRYTPIMK